MVKTFIAFLVAFTADLQDTFSQCSHTLVCLLIHTFATLISWLTLPYSAVTVDLELSDSPTLPL